MSAYFSNKQVWDENKKNFQNKNEIFHFFTCYQRRICRNNNSLNICRCDSLLSTFFYLNNLSLPFSSRYLFFFLSCLLMFFYQGISTELITSTLCRHNTVCIRYISANWFKKFDGTKIVSAGDHLGTINAPCFLCETSIFVFVLMVRIQLFLHCR